MEETPVWMRVLVVLTCSAAAFAGFKVSMAVALALDAAIASLLRGAS